MPYDLHITMQVQLLLPFSWYRTVQVLMMQRLEDGFFLNIKLCQSETVAKIISVIMLGDGKRGQSKLSRAN